MIEVRELSKYYGEVVAVENVSFRVEKGQILGFLGPNGAGKTTTMRVLTCYLPPSAGSVQVAGYDVVEESMEVRRRIGYLPEQPPLYLDMSVADYLRFVAKIKGVPSARLQSRLDETMERTGIAPVHNTVIGHLSKGYKQRVGLAQALVHNPEILVLDEPTIGLDPKQIIEIRQLIKGLGGTHTVILSTHILPEVSMVCERVIIIHEGRVVAIDRPGNLSERLRGTERIEMDIRGPVAQVMTALRNIRGVREVTRTGSGDVVSYNVESVHGADLREQIATLVAQKGWGLLRLQPVYMSLEDIFLRLTAKEADQP